ncbi:MAG: hypothetical protein CVV58_03250 [Tenericutes bacterium HGW-Tenericutes-3]|nr:MAG: hypothetical protein CVV58_03250 [Tenericutes bacterium HGW-Tenericutes-3]
MVFDGFFIYHLVKELHTKLEKARLEKIYQTNEMSFVFVFYLRGQRMFMNLNLSSHNFGAYLTKTKDEATLSSQFLNSLKRNLEGAILQNITQYQTDRVIIFEFQLNDFIDGATTKNLIFEAMGKHSNLLIVKDGLIIDTFKKMFFAEGRQLIPQAQFEFFPTDKRPFTQIDYAKIFSFKDIVDQYMGVSPLLAKYLIEHNLQVENIQIKPTKIPQTNKSYVFDLFDANNPKQHYQSISELMDDQEIIKKETISPHQQFIEKQLKKYLKKREQFSEMLENAQVNLEAKLKGDLIYQSGLSMSSRLSELTSNQETILLDPTKTLNENAQLFFKQYQKAKRSIDHITTQNNQNEELITLFNEFQTYFDLSSSDSIKDFETELLPFGYHSGKPKQNPKKQNQKPNIIKLNDLDIHYYIGKNSLQNEYITHKLAQKDNYWFHVKDFPGAHVVVDAVKLNEAIIRKAAMLAAYFSSMKYSSSIAVDYTQIKHVKKISGKPGYHVTYKNHQTIFIDIDEKKILSYLKNV